MLSYQRSLRQLGCVQQAAASAPHHTSMRLPVCGCLCAPGSPVAPWRLPRSTTRPARKPFPLITARNPPEQPAPRHEPSPIHPLRLVVGPGVELERNIPVERHEDHLHACTTTREHQRDDNCGSGQQARHRSCAPLSRAARSQSRGRGAAPARTPLAAAAAAAPPPPPLGWRRCWQRRRRSAAGGRRRAPGRSRGRGRRRPDRERGKRAGDGRQASLQV